MMAPAIMTPGEVNGLCSGVTCAKELSFAKEHISIELAGYLCLEFLDGSHDDLVLRLLEKIAQCPGPINPFGMGFHGLGLISCDDVVNGPDIATGVELYCLT